MIDRGFIKWQPFSSVISPEEILNHLQTKENIKKPILFEEKQEELNKKIIEAYLSKNKMNISFYEENKIKNITTFITKIYPNQVLKLSNHSPIYFNQIIDIHLDNK